MPESQPQYRCDVPRRAALVLASPLNGIDFLEVLDRLLPPEGSSLRQRVLLVHLLKPVPAGLSAQNVRITGGVRISSITVTWAVPATAVATSPAIPPADRAVLAAVLAQPMFDGARPNILVVGTDVGGDFSPYLLSLTDPTGQAVATGFDRQLSQVTFSFKVECPSDFDCAQPSTCAPEVAQAPAIDYLAKDYDSFRALMLERLSLTLPAWQERNPADVGIVITEILAYAGDQLSYFQDAVANEAYLGTARRRPSLRRHARLLDYTPREGSNARVFVHIAVDALGDGLTLPERTRLYTRAEGLPDAPVALDADGEAHALELGAQVFETMQSLTLHADQVTILFHTWGDGDCCLPKGATRATLKDPADTIGPELVEAMAANQPPLLALIETRGAASGLEVDADPSHRHVVRLTSVNVTTDPLFTGNNGQPLQVIEIEWAADDALPFALCLSATIGGVAVEPLAVARGNVLLADHGQTVEEPLPPMPARGAFRPTLQEAPIAFRGQVSDGAGGFVLFAPTAPAASALTWDPRTVSPAVTLFPIADGGCDAPHNGERWSPARDLLESDGFATQFVVETENDGSAALRFGDGEFGKVPDLPLLACYRVGNGVAGNIGADALAHIATTQQGILAVDNPVPAVGGSEPESAQEIRLSAPLAFQVQERAVTDADYAAITAPHPEVQRAVATRHFTGSWYTVFVTIDRLGGLPVDDAFKQDVLTFLDRFRMAGYDLEVEGAVLVPLDIRLTVCVQPGFFRADVKAALLAALSAVTSPDGTRGFFHPDNFTFGQDVFLSQLLAAALAVPVVLSIDTQPGPLVFQRLGRVASDEIARGAVRMNRLEIAQLDNDPNQPERGRLQLVMQGGQ